MEESKMVLRTEDLVKKYGKRTVVSLVSIDVKQGEIVGLLGPNGAGKTTSFYMTVGLITPNEGRIFLDDLEITKYPVYKRAQTGIGYLAQEASVFRQMSVEDNIASVLEMTNKPPHGNRPLPCYRPEIHHARRTFCRCRPDRRRRYPANCMEVEGQKYRYPDYRPQCAGNIEYYRPCLPVVRRQDFVPRHTGRTV